MEDNKDLTSKKKDVQKKLDTLMKEISTGIKKLTDDPEFDWPHLGSMIHVKSILVNAAEFLGTTETKLEKLK